MERATKQAVPEVPSKWDIIPIHASDISAYKRCRRYWDWSSPTRTNLRRKVRIYGINTDLWFGSGIHYALEMYYNPLIQRDPVEAWLTWYDLQWNGGVVTENWLERTYDNEPTDLGEQTPQVQGSEGWDDAGEPVHLWRVEGLRELLPDPVDEEFEAFRELGVGMMEFYKDYAKREDDFKVIAAESVFSVPLGFEAIDWREDSPNYRKSLPVHARGKRDSIIQRLETGQYGLLENKTKSRIDDNYREGLNKDEQCTNYMWASQTEAEVYDLPWTTISFAIHNAMRKVAPRPPTPLKNGLPSLSRGEESTTAQMFADYVKDNNLQIWFDNTEKAQLYYDYLVREGDQIFIERNRVTRNKVELDNQGKHIRMIAEEMLSDPYIYPSPNDGWLCINCQFRGPCLSADDGSDFTEMLKDGYEENKGR